MSAPLPGNHDEEGDASGFTSRLSGFLGSMLAPVTGLIGATPRKGTPGGGLLVRPRTPVAPTIGFRSAADNGVGVSRGLPVLPKYTPGNNQDDVEDAMGVDAEDDGDEPSEKEAVGVTAGRTRAPLARQWTHTFEDGGTEDRLHRRNDGNGLSTTDASTVRGDANSSGSQVPVGGGVGIPIGRQLGNRSGSGVQSSKVDRSKLKYHSTYVKNMKAPKLRASLKQLGLPQDGLKAALLERLYVALEQLQEDPYVNSPSKKSTRLRNSAQGEKNTNENADAAAPSSSLQNQRSTQSGSSRKRKAGTDASEVEKPTIGSDKSSSKRGRAKKKKKEASSSGSANTRRSTRSTRSSARLKGLQVSAPVEDPPAIRRSTRRSTRNSTRSTRSSASNKKKNVAPARATRSSTRSGRKYRKSPGPAVSSTRASRSSSRKTKNTTVIEEDDDGDEEEEEEEHEEHEEQEAQEAQVEQEEQEEQEDQVEQVEEKDDEDMSTNQEDQASAHRSEFVPLRRAVVRVSSPRATPSATDANNDAADDAPVNSAAPAVMLEMYAGLQEKMVQFERREAAKRAKEKENADRVLRLESENRELHQMLKEQAMQAEERQRQRAAEAAAATKAAAEAAAIVAATKAAKAVAEAVSGSGPSMASSSSSSSELPVSSSAAAAAQPVKPKVKYGSHIVFTGTTTSDLIPLKAAGQPPVTTSIPVVRKLMGMDRNQNKHDGDVEMSASSADQQEDSRMPRADSAFASFG